MLNIIFNFLYNADNKLNTEFIYRYLISFDKKKQGLK